MDYEAVGIDGVQHVEHTIIAPEALYVAYGESTGVHRFTEVRPGVFDAPSAGSYDRRLILDWDGGVLTWAWYWAPAGEELLEQSRAAVQLVGD